MEEEKIAVLEAEINEQKQIIEQIYDKIEERADMKENDSVKIESTAFQLHNLYCAFEDLFKIILDYFENNIIEKEFYHTELLKKMKLNIKGIRPSFVSEESYKFLDELRAFRHFFRHAYGYEIDYSKIKLVIDKVLKLKMIYQNDMDDFIKKLKG